MILVLPYKQMVKQLMRKVVQLKHMVNILMQKVCMHMLVELVHMLKVAILKLLDMHHTQVDIKAVLRHHILFAMEEN